MIIFPAFAYIYTSYKKKKCEWRSDFSVLDSFPMAMSFSPLWTHLCGIFHSFAHLVEFQLQSFVRAIRFLFIA